ncbi:MFS transporter [Azotosporobacter soli]|uniref:MFS transporter n=1 Tax=Azotosporobacter soli TaxID=3055040 RepID=UPI0031FE8C62
MAFVPSDATTLWTRSFLFNCLANLLAFTGMYYIMATLPLYTTEVLGKGNGDVGLLFGAFALAGVLARPLAGRLLDASGRMKTAWFSLLLLFFAMAAYSWTTFFTALLALRIFHGICWGFATTSLATIATDVIPAKQRGEGIGYFGLSMSLAMLLGPWLGLSVLQQFGYPFLFAAGTALAALSACCLFGIRFRVAPAASEQRNKRWLEKSVLAYAAIVFFMAFNYSAVLSFIVLFAQELQIENASLFFLANAVGVIASRPYAGKMLDRQGPILIMCIGFASFFATFVCLFFTQELCFFLLAALLLGIGFGILYSLAFALSINQVDASRRGSVNGTLLTAFDLGFALGALLLGQLSALIGLRAMYLCCALLTVLPFAVFYKKHMQKKAADSIACEADSVEWAGGTHFKALPPANSRVIIQPVATETN